MTEVTPSCDGHHTRFSTVKPSTIAPGEVRSVLDNGCGLKLGTSPDGFALVTSQSIIRDTANQATPTAFNTRSKFLSARRLLPPIWLASCIIKSVVGALWLAGL